MSARRPLTIAAVAAALLAPSVAHAETTPPPPPQPTLGVAWTSNAPIQPSLVRKAAGTWAKPIPAPKPQLPPSPAGPGTYLLWQKSLNRVSIVRNGRIERTMPTTDNDWKTPNGDYPIRSKVTGRYYDQGRWWTLAYFMEFYRRPGRDPIGFHRVPNDAAGRWYQPLNTVGKPGYESHGCLRMLPDDAVRVWNFASIGTVVKVRS